MRLASLVAALLLASAPLRSAAAQEGGSTEPPARGEAQAEGGVPEAGSPGAGEGSAPEDAGGDGVAPERAPARRAPKIAVVVVGDPDGTLRAAGTRVEEAARRGGLRVPADRALREALRGSPGPGEDDGLGPVRSARRRLGLDDEADRALLGRLGGQAGAVALAVVRSAPIAPTLRVFDVREGAFYEGEELLDPDLDEATLIRFLRRRARVAARGEPEVAVPRAGEDAAGPRPVPEAAALPPPEAAAAGGEARAELTEPAPEPAPEPDLFELLWPYGVAALLLGGMITLIVVSQEGGNDTPPPVLRFVPGGD